MTGIEITDAGFCGDSETRRDVDSQRGHFRQISAFSSKEVAHVGLSFGALSTEEVNVFSFYFFRRFGWHFILALYVLSRYSEARLSDGNSLFNSFWWVDNILQPTGPDQSLVFSTTILEKSAIGANRREILNRSCNRFCRKASSLSITMT